MNACFEEQELHNLYQWIDGIPFSRTKKNIASDFSDGVLVAEIIKYYFPRMVDLHNYTPAHSTKQKKENWYLLCRKVLKHLHLELSDTIIHSLVNAKKMAIENVLMMLRCQIDKAIDKCKQSRKRSLKMHTSTDQTGRRKKLSFKNASSNIAKDGQTRCKSRVVQHGDVPCSHPSRVGYSITQISLPILSSPVDNVCKILLDERELENLAKEETIQILLAKLRRLQGLLRLKDTQINDLQSQINSSIDRR